MITISNKDALINNLICNKIEIVFPDGDEETITESNIASESMQLRQSICDDNTLKFGGCIASEFKIDLINSDDRIFTNDLVGKWISVKITQYFSADEEVLPSSTLYPSKNLYPGKCVKSQTFYIFCGLIDSATVDKNDRNKRSIVAFDVLSKLYEQDATNYLFTVLSDSSNNCTIRKLFNDCLNNNGYTTISSSDVLSNVLNEQLEALSADGIPTLGDFKIKNEDWLANQEQLSYGIVLKKLCEMIGMFGVIIPDSSKGKFSCKYIGVATEKYDFYEYLYTEEYIVSGYTHVKYSINGENRDSKSYTMKLNAATNASGDLIIPKKVYDITDNQLVWQRYSEAYEHNLQVMYNGNTGNRIVKGKESGSSLKYTSLNATLDGRLWVEVGDAIDITTHKMNVDGSYVYDENGNIVTETVNTYIFSRTITGIQALTDKIEVKG